MVGLFRTQDGGDFREIEMSDAGELVHDLLLLERDLHRIGQCLPRASAAVLEMRTERGKAMRGRGFHPDDEPLGIAAADLVHLHIHDIAGDCLPDEQHFPVHVRKAVSLGRGRFDPYIFQKRFFLCSHRRIFWQSYRIFF